MSDEPDEPNSDHPENEPPEEERLVQGEIRHHQISARVPAGVGSGVLSNGVLILTGPFEIVLDFVMRLGEQQRIAARVILPPMVGRQFVAALHDNIVSYERRFGALPELPRPIPEPEDASIPTELPSPPRLTEGSEAPQRGSREESDMSAPPEIEEIYRELRIPESMLSGRYANAVLIRHSATEFCFDFITNIYPRSAVSSRVFLAAPHVAPFLRSLMMSLNPPEPPEPNPPVA